jgi:hypothetical protein
VAEQDVLREETFQRLKVHGEKRTRPPPA